MSNTPNLNFQLVSASQSQKNVTVNGSLFLIDMLLKQTVISQTNTPPGAPAEGAIYYTSSSPTGAWTGYAYNFAGYYNGSWIFANPIGVLFYDSAAGAYFRSGNPPSSAFGLSLVTLKAPAYVQAADISVAAAGTATINYNAGIRVQITASGNFTLAVSNFPTSAVSTVTVEAINWGGYSVTWPGSFRFVGGAAPTLTSSGTDVIEITRNSSGSYFCLVRALNVV